MRNTLYKIALTGALYMLSEAASVPTSYTPMSRTVVIESPFVTENIIITNEIENGIDVNTTSDLPLEEASCDPANEIIKTYVTLANNLLTATGLFTTQNLSLFGLSDNHLDPLDFNNELSVTASNKLCAPQKCISIFGKNICTPNLCVSGEANAILEDLHGLSTLKADSATCLEAHYLPGEDRINATGVLKLTVDSLTGNFHADASGSVLGIKIPVSTTGNFTVVDAAPSATVDIQLSFTEENGQRYYLLEDLTFVDIDILFDRVKVDFDAFDDNTDDTFSNIVNPFAKLLIEGLHGDGVIAKPLTELLNGIIKDAIPEVNKFLGSISF
ncbi:hypothetical protein SARC_09888 [Sphaeroforma arctica JP610]|uniref:Lipid-binding serum glycoprotein N-terminal domain-containing protein n=1 Tax=Sphaeroforma arctica JP610 TaxID=667725 RepID=A0A0L0FME2_9EUKA|nr:hypothetical protein SARC_09888 [Sphaeroforma arctica JP610]KNC77656.1 hypothetical protein SARC_09888 [Sphaeroforma arctica JP610]|eukprot:XP_014151558.1 hypothetical protein SARC_09888 [Sphaeroforma arctica JP610]